MNAPVPQLVPRERGPLDGCLGDRPEVGYWVMGDTYETIPRTAWWRCPLCNGQVPLVEGDDVDANGHVVNVVHSQGVAEGRPRCDWDRPLRLIGYEAPHA